MPVIKNLLKWPLHRHLSGVSLEKWPVGDFSHTFHILGVIPTGRYQPGFYPLTGFNRPSLDIGWAFTWFEKNSKLQFNGAVGFMSSLENEATQYQTGDEFHAEWAVGYKFDNGLILGVAGYDYRQITGDSGPGARLGSFIGSQDAVGPALSYSTLIGTTPVVISVRDYEQYDWKNFFRGNVAIASFTAVFPAGQAMEGTPLKAAARSSSGWPAPMNSGRLPKASLIPSTSLDRFGSDSSVRVS